MSDACPLCRATDCATLRAHPLDPCPVYWALREALLPHGGDLPDPAALALFWLAEELGRLEASERQQLARELAELFTYARLQNTRNVRGEEVH